MVQFRNVLAVTISITVPVGAYALLFNRRLERRIPLVQRDQLPASVTKSLRVPGRPKINYVEGYYADLPASKWSRSTTTTKVEDVARVFWTTLPMKLEWNILSFIQWLGVPTSDFVVDPAAKDKPAFTTGKPIMDTFMVEKGVEVKDANEIWFSYWLNPKYAKLILGGVHVLACEQLNERTVRVWFITHLAIDTPAAKLDVDENTRATKYSKYFGYDPAIVDPSTSEEVFKGPSRALLWFHRLYSRTLLDFTARNISMRK